MQAPKGKRTTEPNPGREREDTGMLYHSELTDKQVIRLSKSGAIRWGGHKAPDIYGRLRCSSGEAMSRSKRVFFSSEEEAVGAGYRPCGRCMRAAYLKWKAGLPWLASGARGR